MLGALLVNTIRKTCGAALDETKEVCPDCGAPVQRVVYAANEANYCANCQTGKRLLADRALSRLLKEDWPKTPEELEMLTKTGQKPRSS